MALQRPSVLEGSAQPSISLSSRPPGTGAASSQTDRFYQIPFLAPDLTAGEDPQSFYHATLCYQPPRYPHPA
ncbi:hypothetical protein PUNSTDRAFT_117851 [Punctularia strigosozonata HHB-11173 SS5]|uniref:uncharacterized protein n=1 Tax=Punctularia strigosozonata (strain HHB-11173) TaxID=741275 RepID=UPI0004417632|nr:uncharacterized protein PUNSTDRAFT_117851 [Punctularia strigosozonata HHB-11173 SS5]EIN14327.1 hypothetical protein PUNSTDRAFT_117851 [Punctularia strigosozonata HHB-11173 SS5]